MSISEDLLLVIGSTSQDNGNVLIFIGALPITKMGTCVDGLVLVTSVISC